MTPAKPRLAFISPLFLFPNDAGGKIRTTNILRGLKGGAFEVTLLSPATAPQRSEWADELQGVCDRFESWLPTKARPRWRRSLDLFNGLPVNVVPDRTPAALATVADALATGGFDVCVFDFVHSAVLMPPRYRGATVCFTHNVESEIFGRHAEQARQPLARLVWSSQHRKMQRFEADQLRRFTSVIAVSQRDQAYFRQTLRVASAEVIPTGVDLAFFDWREPPPIGPDHPPTVVFTGSMDWAANVDGVEFFLQDVWPRVVERVPTAQFVVVGRHPPAALVERGRSCGASFTGFVDDVRPYVHRGHVFVIPLRVGGGTRIKAFEAMAMGCPIVSTALGMEGLDVVDGEHYLRRDSAQEQAAAVIELLGSTQRRSLLSRQARDCVEHKFGHRVAARAFERICLRALEAKPIP